LRLLYYQVSTFVVEEYAMNKALVNGMAMLNGIIAFIIVVAGGFFGDLFLHAVGIIVGLIAGFLVAVVVNGLIAAIVQIERHLREMNQLMSEQR
jgi:xanthine/uracil permease